ncbi:MAG TPA: hypothetical protein VII06_39735 [Chloroflexota bacterium]|jgi:hypothetical protein
MSRSPSAPSRARPSCPPRPRALPSSAKPPPAPTFSLWLNAARQECPVPAGGALLLTLLDAAGIAYRLATRAWRDPALAGEPLLVAVGALDGPLEIVHNGALPDVGVAHLRVRPGDEVVVGQPDYLRTRFPFFR